MNKLFRLMLCVTLFSPVVMSGGKLLRVSVRNPADFERVSETITVPLKVLAEYDLPSTMLAVTDGQTGAPLLCQIDEQEFLFQSNFKPRETREFVIQPAKGSVAIATSLVDGRFEPPREDYAWENDRIAYRMYGPALAAEVNNGIDVWTKRVRYLIVDKWYKESAAAGKDTYHEDHGEGADLFSTGRSLGAGGCGIWLEGKLHQPGVFSSYKTICNGPIRVAFELTYDNWKVGGRTLTEHMRISLDAGQNLNRIVVTLDDPINDDSLQLACGLVKRSNTTASTDKGNQWVSLWGFTTNDTANGSLGTGIVFSHLPFLRFTEDSAQYLAISQAHTGKPFVYYAGAGWTNNGNFASEDDWRVYLAAFAEGLRVQLQVTCDTY